MRSRLLTTLVFVFLAAFFGCQPAFQAKAAALSAPNLLVNGDFEIGSAAGKVAGWPHAGAAPALAIKTENGNRFLSIVSRDAKGSASTAQEVRLDAALPGQRLEFSGRIRVKSIAPGPQGWHNARVQTTWKDAAGKELNS